MIDPDAPDVALPAGTNEMYRTDPSTGDDDKAANADSLNEADQLIYKHFNSSR